ncbi:MAG: hypothetical protein ACR2L2_00275 [Acidobacteriota bacterium]
MGLRDSFLKRHPLGAVCLGAQRRIVGGSFRRCLLPPAAWIAALVLWTVPSLAQDLRVGRAAVKITPSVGAPIGSSYGITPAEGVHDDLYAKAIVIEKNGVKAALVACDLISLRGAIVQEARRLISVTTGLRGDQVILSATHAHAGPQMHPLFLALVQDEPRRLGEQYVQRLAGWIADAVRRAEADLTPARVLAGRVDEDSVNFNRRFLMEDGTVRMNPGRRNPDAVRAVGPIDPQLSVVYFESLAGKPLVTLINFALHAAIVGGPEISADYPAVIARLLEPIKGPEMLTVFTNGTSGNVNHIDTRRVDQPSGQAEASRVGTILAAAVLKAYSRLEPIDVPWLRVGTRPVALPVPKVQTAEVEQARQTISRYGKSPAPSFHDVVAAWRVLDLAELAGSPLGSEVQAIALGGKLALVGFPGDAFVELGLAIKQNSPFPFTVVSEQSGNGAISYVPNRKAFHEGGYEAISARFSPGGGELLVDAAVRLLINLYSGDK